MILDCESFDSTISSLSEIFKVSSEKIDKILSDTDYDGLNEKSNFCKPLEDLIFDEFIYKCNHTFSFNEAYCFHLTRTMCVENFQKGIYPLGLIKAELFESLYVLAKNHISMEEWNKIIQCGAGGRNSNLYYMKTSSSKYHGPFALLIKEVAFFNDFGNHDFLKIPEIIEDIGIGINEKYGIDLCELFFDNSVSAIIKFRADIEPNYQKRYLKSALLYLYLKIHNRKLTYRLISISYDGENTIIPFEKISRIEII